MFVASRYISKNSKKSHTSSVLSIVGIAVGVMALTVIIAVMNGFQLGFIESILEISSYHIRIESFPLEKSSLSSGALLKNIRDLPEVVSATPFKEIKGILRSRNSNAMSAQQAAVVRGIPEDSCFFDEGMAQKLDFEDGRFDLVDSHSILLGAELAERLGVGVGDPVDFWTLASGNLFMMPDNSDNQSENPNFLITGIFRTGFYEYDLSWAFINIDTALKLEQNFDTCTLGIKLKNRWKLDKNVSEINSMLTKMLGVENNMSVTTWRDYNKAFFGALRTEKLLMFVLVGLIFIVVALNIFQSQRRSVLERSEEIGLLRSVGATALSVRCVFMFDGIILGLIGSGIGMIVALLIATHIKSFFTGIEFIVNSVLHLLVRFTGSGTENYAIFSPKIFYIKTIPSRIIPHEVILIFLFGFLSAVGAAWFASKKASAIQPSQILRYE
ncbi:MAG: ABC transporter permease [Termitinemataceae bacterium]|nr:MAG: ABC transporter permease [Termitinemataceae bacterium]